MANTKISALTALTGADLANDDAFAVVDTSATATKRITVAELKLGIMPAPGPIGATTPSTGAFTTVSATGNSTVGTTTVYNEAGFARTFGVYDAGSANISIANASAQYQIGVSGVNLLMCLGGSVVTTTSSTGLAVTGTVKASTGMAVGNATPGTGGLAFPATAVAVADANTLDDYEEGTWTPVLKDASAGNAATAATTSANYTKIGRVVNFSLSLLDINTTGLTAGNQIYITGLPFASANVTAQPSISMSVSNVSSTSGSLRAFVGTNNTEITLFNSTTTGSTVAIVSQITSTTGDLYLSGSYIA